MVEVLSEVNWEHWVGPTSPLHWVDQPINKIKNKLQKKELKMLEEQIRDSIPCDVESEEEKNEEF